MDIYKYRDELEAKLAAVNKVIADMGGTAPKQPKAKGKAKRFMSEEAKARMAAAAKKRWAAVKKAGLKTLAG